MHSVSDHKQLSSVVSRVRPSSTAAIAEAARRMAAHGRSVISLSTGELDFDTPEHIQQAAIDAMRQGHTRYTSVAGTAALKQAIIGKFQRDNGLVYSGDQVIAATGAKQIIFNALLATLEPTDEVVFVAPYWVSYPEMVLLTGARPVPVTPEGGDDFKLTPKSLAANLTPNTRWLLLNSPGNPSGALYSAEELRALADVLRNHPRVLVMSDDIYEPIVFEGRFASFAQAVPDFLERTLTVNGVSKSHAMTGWRLGYGGGPSWLIKGIEMLQSQSTNHPSSISQAGAIAALNGPQDFIAHWCERLRARRNQALAIFENAKPLLNVACPPAAFYLYVECGALIDKRTPEGELIKTDVDLCRYLLEGAGVAVVPGTAFGLAPYFRVSYSVSDDELVTACQRIVDACKELL
ncbi:MULTISPECIES: pyridoxal phosphate-dependent aminotransferase [unclassified Pseudomonas]|uniref:pyridoxal phosphate-dependent aminotransferase n=1 Tax=unclassified Pseudomonas TaxID=196821 RepID=UPI00131A7243|nr:MULTISPECIES: pyridoxal phosphate-dependent aminotransferase [unclassified Pseudomonas]